MNGKHIVVQGITVNYRKLAELVFVTGILAIGINLLSSHVYEFLHAVNPILSLVVGSFITLGSLSYIAATLLGKRTSSYTYEGFLVYNPSAKELVPIPQYKMSECVLQYMQTLFDRNHNLQLLWQSDSLQAPQSGSNAAPGPSVSGSTRLLLEAIEFYVLSLLSSQLADYFRSASFNDAALEEHGRVEFARLTVTNRFLYYLTQPSNERSTSKEIGIETTASGNMLGTIQLGNAGTMGEGLRLRLPKASAVKRVGDNCFEIETDKVKVTASVAIDGKSLALPPMFGQYYLGAHEASSNLTAHGLTIVVRIQIGLRALIPGTRWKYYRWVDSFLDQLEEGVSKDAFFERLDWRGAATILQCIEQMELTRSPSHP